MSEKISMPNTIQSDVAQTGPRFDTQPKPKAEPVNDSAKGKGEDVKKKIAKEKTNGWGAQTTNFIKSKQPTVLVAAGLIVAAIAGGLFFANTDLGTSSLQAGLTGANEAAETNQVLQAGGFTAVENSVSGEVALTAETGEGVTHLARKAVSEYASAAGVTLSAEQAVYAEDYLKDQKGSYLLEEGDSVTFTAGEVQGAVEGAMALEDWQIQNLSQFVQ